MYLEALRQVRLQYINDLWGTELQNLLQRYTLRQTKYTAQQWYQNKYG